MFYKSLALIIVLFALFTILSIVNSVQAALEIETNITVGLRPSYTEYKREVQQDGTYEITPISPTTIRVGTGAYVYGFGWAYPEVDGTVNGRSSSNRRAYKVGSWGSTVNISTLRKKYTNKRRWVSAYIFGTFSDKKGTYTWNADAELEAYTYQFINNSWSQVTTPSKQEIEGARGQWTVKEVKMCPRCNKEVDSFTSHQVTCTGCGNTYWKCTAYRVIAAGNSNKSVVSDGYGRHWKARCSECAAIFWVCKNDPIRHHTEETCSVCSETYSECTGGHSCSSGDTDDDSGSTGSGSTGGGSGGGGGSTPPATTPTGGGGGGGDSSNRVRCGYSACSLGGYASSRTAHQSTCPRGHVFWTCKRGTGYGNDYHGDRTCVRSGCGETFTRCSNAHRGNNPCRFNGGGWHTD